MREVCQSALCCDEKYHASPPQSFHRSCLRSLRSSAENNILISTEHISGTLPIHPLPQGYVANFHSANAKQMLHPLDLHIYNV